MRLIDDQGRVFGKVNLIDLLVGLLAASALVVAVAGVVTFRRPPRPIVTEVTPKELAPGPDMRIQLLGDHFLPYLRVFLQRTDLAVGFVRPTRPGEPSDEYTLANASAGAFLVESPRLAEVRLPGGLGPGTYDLVLHNETEQLVVVREAFTVTEAAPPPPPAPDARITVRLEGAFTGVSDDDRKVLVAGAAFDGDRGAILTAGAPRPHVVALELPGQVVRAPVKQSRQIPATIRLECAYVGGECRSDGVVLRPPPAVTIALPIGGKSYRFSAERMTSDSAVTRQARVVVRFVVRPDFFPLISVGDVDFSKDPAGAATLVAVENRRQETAQTVTTLSDVHQQSFALQERVTVFEGTVQLPVTDAPEGWHYNNQLIRAGGVLTFGTPLYSMRGSILKVTLTGGR